MTCHHEAGTEAVVRWSRRLTPNYASRTPTLCAGCESFAVARWHLPYWVSGVLANWSFRVLGAA
ncbi:hypothetical protein [Azospirillum argentinense]